MGLNCNNLIVYYLRDALDRWSVTMLEKEMEGHLYYAFIKNS